jgi:hypothetical protein
MPHSNSARHLLTRLATAALLTFASHTARAVDYTDLWWVPAESGWGVNLVQSDTFLFVPFFIYGPDKKPTWYTAQMTQDASGNFNGALYATTGPYYGSPWNRQDVTLTQVGTASFRPTSTYTGTLTYTVTTPPTVAATVTKSIQRQSLTPITLAGDYVGAQAGTYSGCTNAGDNTSYSDAFDLRVTQFTNGSATFEFNYRSGLSCTLTGTLVQLGQLFTIPAANYSCSGGLDTSASMSEIKATALGIEGRFSAGSVGGGCREDATFGGPLS